jgi:hypothetical protein
MAGPDRKRLEKGRGQAFDTLESAVRMVGQRDAYILEHNLRGEAIIHRLAYYLEEIILKDKTLNLEGYSVDCQYNSGAGYRREYLQVPWPKGSQSQLRKRDQRVRPDLIVHQRGTDGVNLLMVEVKKSSTISQAARKFALLKGQAYRASGLSYLFTGYVCFIMGQNLNPRADPFSELLKFP